MASDLAKARHAYLTAKAERYAKTNAGNRGRRMQQSVSAYLLAYAKASSQGMADTRSGNRRSWVALKEVVAGYTEELLTYSPLVPGAGAATRSWRVDYIAFCRAGLIPDRNWKQTIADAFEISARRGTGKGVPPASTMNATPGLSCVDAIQRPLPSFPAHVRWQHRSSEISAVGRLSSS